MPSSMIPTLSNLEMITVRIDVGQITTVCTVYVPPCACYNYQVSLLTYLNNIVSTSDCVLIVSDFNLLDISGSSLTGTSPFSNSLCELIFDLNLMQHVNSPTHLKGNILDLVLTNVDTIQDLANGQSTSTFSSLWPLHYHLQYEVW